MSAPEVRGARQGTHREVDGEFLEQCPYNCGLLDMTEMAELVL